MSFDVDLLDLLFYIWGFLEMLGIATENSRRWVVLIHWGESKKTKNLTQCTICCTSGKVIDRWNIQISLWRTKQVEDVTDFYIEQTVQDGFMAKEEFLPFGKFSQMIQIGSRDNRNRQAFRVVSSFSSRSKALSIKFRIANNCSF